MSIAKYLKKPSSLYVALASRGFCNWVSDERHLSIVYKDKTGRVPNLRHPQTFTEKLNWLKMHDRKPLYNKIADKVTFKDYVTERVGVGHVVPTLGVWDTFDDIDFDSLPKSFVLKCTHDSGSIVVCKDKGSFDRFAAKASLERSLKRCYYDRNREWPYKGIKPRILAEDFIPILGRPDSIEYKMTCFNGKVGFVTVCGGIAHTDFNLRTNDSFDVGFNHMPWYAYYKNAPVLPEKPDQWDELIGMCEKLADGIPTVRVDAYILDGSIVFGEMTFYTWGGVIEFTPPEWDEVLGSWLELPGGAGPATRDVGDWSCAGGPKPPASCRGALDELGDNGKTEALHA